MKKIFSTKFRDLIFATTCLFAVQSKSLGDLEILVLALNLVSGLRYTNGTGIERYFAYYDKKLISAHRRRRLALMKDRTVISKVVPIVPS